MSQLGLRHLPRLARSAWRPTWPGWLLVLFASLAATRLLPAGYVRAVVAAPILVMVPGSVTLGAAFSRPRRPSGVEFACWAALLGVGWSVFASLALYAAHVTITATSTYAGLLAVTAALAIAAQVRLMREPRGARVPRAADPDRVADPARVADPDLLADPDLSGVGAAEAGRLAAVRAGRYHAIAAVLAGVVLLAGGAYAWEHIPHPVPVGYTTLAWAGQPVQGVLPVGPAGATLPFQVAHQEPGTATFRLSAVWLGSPPRPLAGPLTVTVGPNRTFRGTLFVPPLPDGCTYRIVLTLARAQPPGATAGQPQTWSVNADVHQAGTPQRGCP